MSSQEEAMRALILLMLFIAVSAASADTMGPIRSLPTYGRPEKDSILVSILGTGVEKEGRYYVRSTSLFRLVTADEAKISSRVDRVKVHRGEDRENPFHPPLFEIVKLRELDASHDFTLRASDWLIFDLSKNE
jgi:hypothetical protein